MNRKAGAWPRRRPIAGVVGAPLGPLDGVPVAIKDTAHVAGWPTRIGSHTTPAAPSTEDTPGVARLREAGAVFFCKTTTPEFGWKGITHGPLTGITRNPWDTSRTPGGSSGGSAALGGSGRCAAGHRRRWRRLDPDSGGVQRRVRIEGELWRGAEFS